MAPRPQPGGLAGTNSLLLDSGGAGVKDVGEAADVD